MKWLLSLLALGTCLAKQPFQSMDGVVGYIVLEKKGKLENYVIAEGKDGSVKAIKVDKNPARFIRKSEEKRGGENK